MKAFKPVSLDCQAWHEFYSQSLAFPVPETKVVHAQNYGMSLWGKTAKVIVKLPSGKETNYFLKVIIPRNTKWATANADNSGCYNGCHRKAYVPGRIRIFESHSCIFS